MKKIIDKMIQKRWLIYSLLVLLIIIEIYLGTHNNIFLSIAIVILEIRLLVWDCSGLKKELSKVNLEDLYRYLNLGEAFLNFFGILYVPIVIWIIGLVNKECLSKAAILISLGIIVLDINIKIYCYKEEIRRRNNIKEK